MGSQPFAVGAGEGRLRGERWEGERCEGEPAAPMAVLLHPSVADRRSWGPLTSHLGSRPEADS